MSLQVWLPLTGDLHNQGLSPTTFSGTPAWKTYGKLTNSSLNLQNRITCSTPSLNGVQFFSVAFWGRIEANPDSTANWMDVIGFTDISTSGSSGQFRFETGYGSTSQGGIHWHDNATNAIVNGTYTFNKASEQNNWHHIVVTVSDNALKSYYDGVLVHTKSDNLNKGHLNGNWWLGESTTRGCIQDVRIYDHALSDKEVEEIAKGLVLHYKLDNNGLGGKNFAYGTTTKIVTATATGTDKSATTGLNYGFQSNWAILRGKTITISCDIELINATHTSGVGNHRVGIEPAIKYSDNTTQYYGIWVSLNSTPQTSSKRYYKTVTLPDKDFASMVQNGMYIQNLTNGTATVKNVKIELGSVATPWSPNPADLDIDSSIIYDSSGYGNDGILNSNLLIDTDTPRYFASSYFGNYETPKITLQDPSILTNLTNCTVCWWGKYDTTKTLLLTGQSTSIYLAASDNNTFYHGSSGSPIMYKNGINGTYKCVANSWDFYVLKNVDLSTWTTMKINGYSTGWPLKGLISDFRIYATALTAEQILELYHTSASIDNNGNIYARELVEE